MISICFPKEQERKTVEEKRALRKKIWLAAAIYAGVIFAILIIANTEKINLWLSGVFRIFRPIVIGLVAAYLCNPFFRFFERKIFFRLRPPKLRRAISLICAFLMLLLMVALLLLLILPQLFESITTFTKNYNSYLSSAINKLNDIVHGINGFFARFIQKDTLLQPIDPQSLPNLLGSFFGSEGILAKFSLEIGSIINALSQTLSAITDFILGLFIAIYLLSTKEKRAAQLMKLRRAIFNDRINEHITRFISTADDSFGGFFTGKLMDSLIVGVLTYVLTSIFDIHYALLISTFIALTNIIPIIGPVIGAIPTAFILLLSQPDKVLIYILIIVLIVQIDNNIIAPKILGENTGVSSLCVLIAITTMGNLWGLIGMLLGVPLFATVLELVELYIIDRLQKKGLPSGLGNYYAPDTIVDPSRDIQSHTHRLVAALEREYLRTERCIRMDVTAPLTKKQIFYYRIYRLGMRLRLINEPSESAVVQYSIDETLLAAEKASEAAFQAHMKAFNATKEQPKEAVATDEHTRAAESTSDDAASQSQDVQTADQAPSEEPSSEQTKS